MDIINLLARIDELKVEIDRFRPLKPEQEQRIFKKFRLDWNFNSNAIEGNQVSLGETQIFLDYGLTSKGKPFKDYLDIRGHDTAITFLLDVIRNDQLLNEAVIRELHKILLVEAYEVDAITPDRKATKKLVKLGEYKSTPNHVLTPTGTIHNYASPEETPALMGDLIQWYREKTNNNTLHPVIIAATFHHRFLQIHPFDDGNGRLSRLLMNLILIHYGYPPVIIRAARRDQYIFDLRKADQMDSEGLEVSIAEELIKSEELYLRGAKGEPVEDIDDIDKEIGLLKLQLKHIDEPVELSIISQNKLFTEQLTPLFQYIARKLSQFDDFFTQASADISGAHYLHGNLHVMPTQTTSISTVGDYIKNLSVHPGVIHHLIVTLNWRFFKKTPLAPLDLTIQFQITFEKLKYTIDAPQPSIHELRVYDEGLDQKLINDTVKRACDYLIQAIRHHTKQSV